MNVFILRHNTSTSLVQGSDASACHANVIRHT